MRTRSGQELQVRVDEPQGDPGNTLSRPELEAKAHSLAAYKGGASSAEMQQVTLRVWALEQALEQAQDLRHWLPNGSTSTTPRRQQT